MARGDLQLFEEFMREEGEKIHDFNNDTFKFGIVDNTLAPTAADATPRWGDYSANEVSAAGGYVADGITLANVAYTEVGGVAKLDFDDFSLVKDASGFTDGAYGIIYNSTDASKRAVGYAALLDGATPVSEQAGAINFNVHASGVFTKTLN